MSLPMLAEAEAEMNHATEWYAERDPRVAVRFNEALIAAFDAIAAAPHQYPLAEDAPEGRHVRNFLLVPAFPFRVVYLVAEPRVVIIAVAHTSRAAGYWANRVANN